MRYHTSFDVETTATHESSGDCKGTIRVEQPDCEPLVFDWLASPDGNRIVFIRESGQQIAYTFPPIGNMEMAVKAATCRLMDYIETHG